MPRPQKATFNNDPTENEVEVFCYFCGARRIYWKRLVKRMKQPFRCKHCAAKIRTGELEDVTHDG